MSAFLLVKNFYSRYKEEILFVSKVIAIYLATKIFFSVMGREVVPIQDRMFPFISSRWEIFNDWVRLILLNGTSFVLSLLGHTVVINGATGYVTALGMGTLGIGNYCIGIRLWIYFSELIIAYPGKWKKKLPFILFGIVCINLMNICRFVGLMYVVAYKPSLLAFSHEYLFNYIIYGFAVFMLYLWITRFNSLKPESN